MQYKKIETREKILESAKGEFYEFGEANASIRRIAEKSNVAVGNIYNYFDSKNDLYCEIIFPVRKKIDSFFELALNLEVSPKGLEEVADDVVPYMVETRREIRLLMNTVEKNGDKAKERYFDMTGEKIKFEFDKICEKRNRPKISKEYARAIGKSFLYGIFEILFSSDDTELVRKMLSDFFMFFFRSIEKRI